MSPKEQAQLASDTLVAEASAGMVVTYRGETSNMAYFILKGSVGVGYKKDDEYVILNYLREGDFFGEVAALTGSQRTANIITEEASEFLIIPSRVMQRLAQRYEGMRRMIYATMNQRLSTIELLPGMGLSQELLRELRTPDMETEPDGA